MLVTFEILYWAKNIMVSFWGERGIENWLDENTFKVLKVMVATELKTNYNADI